ncbi:DMT family transporter [Sandaracinus amylolyticus]|uniref:Permease of the drug/metabolite transporter (DMT) superfamily n=1 Tax=Sandaracinus amylolyticus TaxID=927083 RepID=A0A0F6WA30_9BACT|nr:DMT family transporter [Sandaracinus amylolyticus]AKF11202.1 Permease of the drug/metabolite transporter (DMT) superfamily [Sandaracinus amylolyticus]
MNERSVAFDLAVGAFAIAWAAIFLRLAGDVDPLVSSALRLGIAAVLLAPWAVRAARAGTLDRQVRRSAAIAGLLYAVHFGTWVASLALTSVAASVTLVTATPLLLAIIGVLRGRDRPTRDHGWAIAITTIGVVMIGGADASLSRDALIGDVLALVGALAMALYLLVARELGERLEPLAFSSVAAGVGALALGLVCAAETALGVDVLAHLDGAALGWIALSALVPQVVGHTLLTRALRRATPTMVGLATCAEPVLSTLLAVPILAEVPTPLVIAGCVVTIAGVMVGMRRSA